MSGWWMKNLGDAMLAGEERERIERLFARAYAAAGRPKGMAVLARHESEGRLHCDLVVYFSPAAATVAREVDAIPCEQPAPGDLSVLAGDDGALVSLSSAGDD